MRRSDVSHGKTLHHKITDAKLYIIKMRRNGAFAQETGMTPRLYHWGELFRFWDTTKREVTV